MSKLPSYDRLNTSFLLGTLLLALTLVPMEIIARGLRTGPLVACFAMVFLVGTAISAGYHRLFAHRSYSASSPVRLLLLLFGAASFQNSALKWASDHRRHHRFVDTDEDPYNIGKGFWYAHWLWVMRAGDFPLAGVEDLRKDRLVMWQHRHHFKIGALVSVLLPLALGLFWGDVLGYLVFAVVLRIVLTHHTTFLINSAAHMFGTRPYSDANSARDNAWLAPLTYGEGFHNFHHMWQWDYRNGARWYQYDSTKWLLCALRLTGLVSNLKRVPDAVVEKARVRMEEKALQERLRSAPAPGPLDTRLAAARQQLETALASLHEAQKAWAAQKAEWRAKGLARAEAWKSAKAEWRAALERHREELQEAWKEWRAARLAVRLAVGLA